MGSILGSWGEKSPEPTVLPLNKDGCSSPLVAESTPPTDILPSNVAISHITPVVSSPSSSIPSNISSVSIVRLLVSALWKYSSMSIGSSTAHHSLINQFVPSGTAVSDGVGPLLPFFLSGPPTSSLFLLPRNARLSSTIMPGPEVSSSSPANHGKLSPSSAGSLPVGGVFFLAYARFLLAGPVFWFPLDWHRIVRVDPHHVLKEPISAAVAVRFVSPADGRTWNT
jgi:hypothetical protein